MLVEMVLLSSLLTMGLIEIPPSALSDPIFRSLMAEWGHGLIAAFELSSSACFKIDRERSAKLCMRFFSCGGRSKGPIGMATLSSITGTLSLVRVSKMCSISSQVAPIAPSPDGTYSMFFQKPKIAL